jgi:hypothetical protein
MALLQINGVDIPAPSDLQVGIMDITKAERNANGLMIIERIAQKRKLSLSYSYLDAGQLQSLLNAMSAIYFNVRYLDPASNTFKTSSFYSGDRNVGMIDYRNGVARYKDIRFDLIER